MPKRHRWEYAGWQGDIQYMRCVQCGTYKKYDEQKGKVYWGRPEDDGWPVEQDINKERVPWPCEG